jgi:hypothetical protein
MERALRLLVLLAIVAMALVPSAASATHHRWRYVSPVHDRCYPYDGPYSLNWKIPECAARIYTYCMSCRPWFRHRF